MKNTFFRSGNYFAGCWGCLLDFVKKDAVMSYRLSGRSTD